MKKRKIKSFPEPQKQTLLEMYRNHQKSRMRERAHMVLLSSQKRSIKEICSIVFRSENTVSTWLDAYENMGFLGLYDEDIPGRPPGLDKNQQEQIATWLDDSPRKEGYQQSNWTLKLVAHHLLQKFGVHFMRTYHQQYVDCLCNNLTRWVRRKSRALSENHLSAVLTLLLIT